MVCSVPPPGLSNFIDVMLTGFHLGKVYISANQPIQFNSELDDKSRFENVEYLEKYIT